MITLSRPVLMVAMLFICLSQPANGQPGLQMPGADFQFQVDPVPNIIGPEIFDPTIGVSEPTSEPIGGGIITITEGTKYKGLNALGKGDCEGCMPGPVVVPVNPPRNWPPPSPGNPSTGRDCMGLACLSEFTLSPSWLQGFPASPLIAAASGSEDMSYHAALLEAMQETDADGLCLNVARIILPDTAGPCQSGTLSVAEDLAIAVTAREDAAVDFVIEIWGRSKLLAGVGRYEHHTYNLAFGMRMDGTPRIMLFNRLPLYTTWDNIETVKRLIEDVKYIPRKQDDLLEQLNNKFSRGFKEFLDREAANAYYD